jgi:ABC-type oligopeptide transport system ATPase subunit
MARKYGKKNKVKADILSYNIGLLGISGFGKSTLAKEVCETLAGEEGYISLDISKENGHDAIPDIVSEQIPDWRSFIEFKDDVIKNKDTDYKDLKVVIYDTIDDLFELAEKEVIRLHNRKHPEKPTDSINVVFGGFGRGQDKAIELVIEALWELKSVGVAIFVIGHTKVKTMSDPITDNDYEMLTTNMSMKYFNAIKNKLHILGVGTIERDIKKVNTGKNPFTGKVESKGVVENERRVISFRDDNYSVDSKSRFAEITPKIKLDHKEFIKAIEDAIALAHSKQKDSKPLEDARKEQEALKEKETKENQDKLKEKLQQEEVENKRDTILDKIELHKSTPAKMKPFAEKFKSLGYTTLDDVQKVTLEHAEELLKLL